ncbi:MAG: M20/M25/M40 family metallo-hydrolase, partial [Spirochaetaceae bacterium]|nr:M20/M25/M40 family metallo-hydrolase [Spirochaetaceae bacterium]
MTAYERFAEIIKLPTVSSYDPKEEDSSVFKRFPELLAELYPSAHTIMERELIGDRSIVYQWAGTTPSLEPVLCMAHYDVVPPGNPEEWERLPFSGEISGGRIYGRGTLDDKGMLAAWMEAAERLAVSGFQPERTLYFAFGGDEETTGLRGAGKMASVFAERGLNFAFLLDEGGAVTTDQLTGFTDRPVALIGAAEKGYLTLEITAKGLPGHASAPPEHSAIGLLSDVVSALESRPFPLRLTDIPAGMLQTLGMSIGGLKGFLLKHNKIFSFLILKLLAGNSSMAGMVRTTLAPTVIRGGERDNVLPAIARAHVNIRILHGESVASVIVRIEKIILKTVSGGVTVKAVEGAALEPVPPSPISGLFWDHLRKQAEETWSDVIVAPYLMTAATDSRWYRNLTNCLYRFIPMEVGEGDIKGVHAPNESVS